MKGYLAFSLKLKENTVLFVILFSEIHDNYFFLLTEVSEHYF